MLDLMQQYWPKENHPSQTNARFKPPQAFESLEVVYIDESGVPGFGVSPLFSKPSPFQPS